MAEIVKEVSEQLKEILPALIGAKQILGDAAEDHKQVKDLIDQLKNLQGNVLEMGKNIVELGKRKIHVQATGLSDEEKLDFAKWIVNFYKASKKPNAESLGIMKELCDKYAQKTTLDEVTDATAGYAVPTAFSREIWRVAEQASIILAGSTRIPLTVGYKMPLLSLASSVSFSYVEEAGAIPETNPSLGKKSIDAKKLGGYTILTNELLEDEDIGIVDLLIQLFSEALGKKIDQDGFYMNGPQFNGILYTSGVNLKTLTGGKGKFTEVDGDDLIDAAALLPAPNLVGAKWYLHRTILAVVKKLKAATTGEYLWQSMSAGEPATIWGYPYTICEQMPSSSDTAVNTPFMFFGNLKNYCVGLKRDLQLKISDIPLILNDESIVVMTYRHALGAALPAGFVVIKTANVDS